jgi:hypothetical protein
MTARLEDLKPDAQITGLASRVAVRLFFCAKEALLEIASTSHWWSVESDGHWFGPPEVSNDKETQG